MDFGRIRHDVAVERQRWSELPRIAMVALPIILGLVALRGVYKEWHIRHVAVNEQTEPDASPPLPPE